jgi:hypothetical protein
MKANEIARKNDLMRSTFMGCRVVVTRALSESENRDKVLSAVHTFNQFTKENDPYGEHDFAIFEVDGEEYFFKFEYYDDKYEFFREDGNRVLTIGFSNEY